MSEKEKDLKIFILREKLRRADFVMQKIDTWVQKGLMDARSSIADLRLLYSEPFEYEYLTENDKEELANLT